jgi:hypothetical protein
MSTETVRRGCKPIEVTPVELAEFIGKLEKETSFPNRSHLWKALENSEWALTRNPRPLTAQVAMTMAKKFNIAIQTPVGIRGRVKGQGPIARPKNANKISYKKAVRDKCMDCSNNQKKEIAYCPVTDCPLYSVRPFKLKSRQGLISLPQVGG